MNENTLYLWDYLNNLRNLRRVVKKLLKDTTKR